MNASSKTRRRAVNPNDLRIIVGGRRQEPTDVTDQWEIEIGFHPPGNNDSVFPLLDRIEAKGVRLALRNPHPPDAITVAILAGSGASLIKTICRLIDTWMKGRSERKVSITAPDFKIETMGFSRADIEKLTRLATPVPKRTALLKPKSRKGKASKAGKKKSVTARK